MFKNRVEQEILASIGFVPMEVELRALNWKWLSSDKIKNPIKLDKMAKFFTSIMEKKVGKSKIPAAIAIAAFIAVLAALIKYLKRKPKKITGEDLEKIVRKSVEASKKKQGKEEDVKGVVEKFKVIYQKTVSKHPILKKISFTLIALTVAYVIVYCMRFVSNDMNLLSKRILGTLHKFHTTANFNLSNSVEE
jgi:hypothetical protein